MYHVGPANERSGQGRREEVPGVRCSPVCRQGARRCCSSWRRRWSPRVPRSQRAAPSRDWRSSRRRSREVTCGGRSSRDLRQACRHVRDLQGMHALPAPWMLMDTNRWHGQRLEGAPRVTWYTYDLVQPPSGPARTGTYWSHGTGFVEALPPHSPAGKKFERDLGKRNPRGEAHRSAAAEQQISPIC